jgi:hypothetical protein
MGMGENLVLLRRRMRKMPRMTRAMTARPPTTPPTMAPTGVEELEGWLGGVTVAVAVTVVRGRRVVEISSVKTVWTRDRPVWPE